MIGLTLIFSPIWKNVQSYLEKRGVLNLDVLQRINFFTQGKVSEPRFAGSPAARMLA